jgi:branched-chain amino acid transport system ATP-binding protein
VTALLDARACTMQFGGLKALSTFSLTIEKGDLKGLIGPNGAGKTTAFNVLTGVYAPTSGDVIVDGVRVNGRMPHQINRAGLARTFQNIRLFKELTALDNVKVGCLSDATPFFPRSRVEKLRRDGNGALAFTLEAWGNYLDWWRAFLLTPGFLAEERDIEERAKKLLDVMNLGHRADEQAQSLPYGEQRRLEIARALATGPKVLLLDEPAAGMNPNEKGELSSFIRSLRDRFDLTIVLIEHHVPLVMGLCDRIAVLNFGQLIALGDPAAVQQDPAVIDAYLGAE